MSFRRIGYAAALAAALSVSSAAVSAPRAQAQTMFNEVDAVPKGTIGLGLVGAELGFAIPALAGLHKTWAFIVFPIIGAAGGAVGGYFAFDNPNHPELAVAFLAVGMALIVPTLVLTLKMTSYDPGDEEDAAPDDAAMEEEFGDPEAEPEARAPVDERVRRARAGAGLLRVSEDGLLLGMPGLNIRPAYSEEDVQRYGLSQHAEVHLPLVSGTF